MAAKLVVPSSSVLCQVSMIYESVRALGALLTRPQRGWQSQSMAGSVLSFRLSRSAARSMPRVFTPNRRANLVRWSGFQASPRANRELRRPLIRRPC